MKTSSNPNRFHTTNLPPKPTISKPKPKPNSIDNVSTAASAPRRSAREAMLLKKYGSLISKAQMQVYGYITLKPRIVVEKKKIPSIEEKRKAAREALEKMEKSVEIDDNWKTMMDMKQLCLWPTKPYVGGFF